LRPISAVAGLSGQLSDKRSVTDHNASSNVLVAPGFAASPIMLFTGEPDVLCGLRNIDATPAADPFTQVKRGGGTGETPDEQPSCVQARRRQLWPSPR
jgi:hypothetical protein